MYREKKRRMQRSVAVLDRRQFEVTGNVRRSRYFLSSERRGRRLTLTPLGLCRFPLLGFGGITMCRCRSTFRSGSISPARVCPSFECVVELRARRRSATSVSLTNSVNLRDGAVSCAPSHDNGTLTKIKNGLAKNKIW